ncbi:50S ribosomal protein L11 methyltransferase [Marinobacter lutaoensis]|jgi:ribosomal protein L11 methyltransferase|uniref:50S ribosomal protein L11 methyltransferase n=1 Tax=Marinobacter lutaoensis TaxID=135739 RepID=UPI000C0B5145|nr:50S ribosomal protein L11 methyltransferase [Marinobacter lutaoensis]MBE02529.1 50S ribosomal protein L11 methyltransferase [Marinobacter sp.]MBI43676.1 50S ribosomal protein L11 methyltransferase [Oceanospirillales bacterium]NVD36236.1 50S ribosomal protein L11 methyltransferase [Marinobacter lutaoensis]|tara:strand:+ start:1459 stop:2355 length:897 start_codon:yes stop_codon:yes gene_type:complete
MPWIQLQIPADPDTADQLEDLLMALGADAVSMEDAADQPLYEPDPGTTPLWSQTRVTGLFQSGQDIEQLCAEIRDAWHQQTQQSLADIEVTLVEDKDWERAWMDDFQPLRFGDRLWIVPSWHSPPNPDAANLLLDPGLAFGTGTHPTTALCLEWLDGQDMSGKQVIDYGCGSGILGLAALLLGAAHVTGVDTDPQALEASRDNALRNGIETHRLDLYLPENEPDTPCDVLLANILANPLIDLAPRLARLTRPGGDLVLSGILAPQAREVMAAYEPWFLMDEPEQKEEWIRLTGRRRDR